MQLRRHAFPFTLALAALLFLGSLPKYALADESLVVLAKIFPVDGKEGNIEEYLRTLIAYIKSKEPDITYRLHRTDKPTTTLMFYEVYPSQEAFESHRKNVAAFRDEHGKLPDEFLAKPTENERYSIGAVGAEGVAGPAQPVSNNRPASVAIMVLGTVAPG